MTEPDNRIRGGRLMLIVSCMLVLASLSVSVSSARLQTSQSASFSLTNALKDNFLNILNADGDVLSSDEWTHNVETGFCSRTFRIGNGTSADGFSVKSQRVAVRLFVPAADAEEAETDIVPEVLLTVGNEQYVGTAEPVVTGSLLWRSNGSGTVYSFYTQNGEEAGWVLPGGELSDVDMELTVSDFLPFLSTKLLTERTWA